MVAWSTVRDPVGVRRGVPMVRVAVVIPVHAGFITTDHMVRAVPVHVTKGIPVRRPAVDITWMGVRPVFVGLRIHFHRVEI